MILYFEKINVVNTFIDSTLHKTCIFTPTIKDYFVF